MKKYSTFFSFLIILGVMTLLSKECMTKTPLTLIKHDYKEAEITQLCQQGIDHIKTSIDAYLKIPANQRNFNNTVEAIETLLSDFNNSMNGPVFMAYVHPNKKIRDEAFACEEKMSKFLVEVSLRKDLYNAFQAFQANLKDDFSKLSADEQRLVTLTIRDYKKSGLWLADDKLNQVRALKKELSELETKHGKNLVEDKSSITVTQEELKGTPESLQRRLKKTEDGKFIVNARGATFFQFMETAESEAARKRLWVSYTTRAVPENTKLLERGIQIRAQLSKILGYNNWVDYRTDGRMAQNSKTVINFLDDLKVKLAAKNTAQLAKLFEMKKEDNPAATSFEQWDRMYYSNKLKKRDFNVDTEEVRQYFPSNRVIQGTFDIYSKLLGVEFKEVKNANLWHETVKLFEIKDKASQKGIGHFFADLYPREGKYSHAAAFTLSKGRGLPNGGYQKTISSIVANLNPPSKDKPSLMSHSDVETFFHEFGHIMHQTLTKARYDSFSGTSVARDFVEAPSQMLENWVWDADMLDLISGHYKDESKKLPTKLRESLLKLSHFNNGIRYTRQVYYATLDYKLHSSGENVDAIDLADKLRMEIIGIPNPPNTAWVASFGHLMGGYDAGYYGYLWSEVYAQDMFTKFEQEGLLNEQVGMAYRKLILERGSAKEEVDLLKDFLGRKPNQDAFYRKLGIKE